MMEGQDVTFPASTLEGGARELSWGLIGNPGCFHRSVNHCELSYVPAKFSLCAVSVPIGGDLAVWNFVPKPWGLTR